MPKDKGAQRSISNLQDLIAAFSNLGIKEIKKINKSDDDTNSNQKISSPDPQAKSSSANRKPGIGLPKFSASYVSLENEFNKEQYQKDLAGLSQGDKKASLTFIPKILHEQEVPDPKELIAGFLQGIKFKGFEFDFKKPQRSEAQFRTLKEDDTKSNSSFSDYNDAIFDFFYKKNSGEKTSQYTFKTPKNQRERVDDDYISEQYKEIVSLLKNISNAKDWQGLYDELSKAKIANKQKSGGDGDEPEKSNFDKLFFVEIVQFLQTNKEQLNQLPFSFVKHALTCQISIFKDQLKSVQTNLNQNHVLGNVVNNQYPNVFFKIDNQINQLLSQKKTQAQEFFVKKTSPALYALTEQINRYPNLPHYLRTPTVEDFESKIKDKNGAPAVVIEGILSDNQLQLVKKIDDIFFQIIESSSQEERLKKIGKLDIRLRTGTGKSFLADLIEKQYSKVLADRLGSNAAHQKSERKELDEESSIARVVEVEQIESSSIINIDLNSPQKWRELFSKPPLDGKADLLGKVIFLDEAYYYDQYHQGESNNPSNANKEIFTKIRELRQRGAIVIIFGASESINKIEEEIKQKEQKIKDLENRVEYLNAQKNGLSLEKKPEQIDQAILRELEVICDTEIKASDFSNQTTLKSGKSSIESVKSGNEVTAFKFDQKIKDYFLTEIRKKDRKYLDDGRDLNQDPYIFRGENFFNLIKEYVGQNPTKENCFIKVSHSEITIYEALNKGYKLEVFKDLKKHLESKVQGHDFAKIDAQNKATELTIQNIDAQIADAEKKIKELNERIENRQEELKDFEDRYKGAVAVDNNENHRVVTPNRRQGDHDANQEFTIINGAFDDAQDEAQELPKDRVDQFITDLELEYQERECSDSQNVDISKVKIDQNKLRQLSSKYDFVVLPVKKAQEESQGESQEEGIQYLIYKKGVNDNIHYADSKEVFKKIEELKKQSSSNLQAQGQGKRILVIFDKKTYIGGDIKDLIFDINEQYIYFKDSDRKTKDQLMQALGRDRSTSENKTTKVKVIKTKDGHESDGGDKVFPQIEEKTQETHQQKQKDYYAIKAKFNDDFIDKIRKDLFETVKNAQSSFGDQYSSSGDDARSTRSESQESKDDDLQFKNEPRSEFKQIHQELNALRVACEKFDRINQHSLEAGDGNKEGSTNQRLKTWLKQEIDNDQSEKEQVIKIIKDLELLALHIASFEQSLHQSSAQLQEVEQDKQEEKQAEPIQRVEENSFETYFQKIINEKKQEFFSKWQLLSELNKISYNESENYAGSDPAGCDSEMNGISSTDNTSRLSSNNSESSSRSEIGSEDLLNIDAVQGESAIKIQRLWRGFSARKNPHEEERRQKEEGAIERVGSEGDSVAGIDVLSSETSSNSGGGQRGEEDIKEGQESRRGSQDLEGLHESREVESEIESNQPATCSVLFTLKDGSQASYDESELQPISDSVERQPQDVIDRRLEVDDQLKEAEESADDSDQAQESDSKEAKFNKMSLSSEDPFILEERSVEHNTQHHVKSVEESKSSAEAEAKAKQEAEEKEREGAEEKEREEAKKKAEQEAREKAEQEAKKDKPASKIQANIKANLVQNYLTTGIYIHHQDGADENGKRNKSLGSDKITTIQGEENHKAGAYIKLEKPEVIYVSQEQVKVQEKAQESLAIIIKNVIESANEYGLTINQLQACLKYAYKKGGLSNVRVDKSYSSVIDQQAKNQAIINDLNSLIAEDKDAEKFKIQDITKIRNFSHSFQQKCQGKILSAHNKETAFRTKRVGDVLGGEQGIKDFIGKLEIKAPQAQTHNRSSEDLARQISFKEGESSKGFAQQIAQQKQAGDNPKNKLIVTKDLVKDQNKSKVKQSPSNAPSSPSVSSGSQSSRGGNGSEILL